MLRAAAAGLLLLLLVSVPIAQAPLPDALDKTAAGWVDETFKKLTIEDKVGQLVVSAISSTYLSSDTDAFETLTRKVRNLRVGGFHVFGGTEPIPNVLLNNNYGSVVLGQPLDAASLLNRLQSLSTIPLLNTADFEAGAGFRIEGATVFPRAMAIGAAGDEMLAFESARITALEARAMGIHVNFAPIADVNNNARNPVINTRAFGELPDAVGRLVSAYVRGLHAGGMLATLKHFPGHGDTDVDSHLGLPIINHPRERLEKIELAPFRAGMAAGADAVMTAHIQLPALDAGEFSPATLSPAIVKGLLREQLKFEGLIYTDSMSMDAISRRIPPGEAAARAIRAGNDIVLHSPDDEAVVAGIKAAVEKGDIPQAQLDASVRRILTTKARLGLYKTRLVPLDELPKIVGGRAHAAVAQELGKRSITLVKDDRNQVPLRAPREASLLYLSILDYSSGWRIAAPSRTFLAGLRQRWPATTAIELSDRSTSSEIDLIRAAAPRYDAIVASVFVRAASGSGRMDLAPALVRLLSDLARTTTNSPRPFITVFFGNPYIPAGVPGLPAILLTYDFYDLAEASALRALIGEAPITGRLPIALPGMFEAGWGIVR
ncbi:MAG TPA: glycoside hydrolase family 3 protein [Vicinamibacterales bacterium]